MTVYKNDANLQALWLMEETSGTRYDETDNNNDLTDNNTVTYSATHQEGSYSASFDKANSEYLSRAYASVTFNNKEDWSFVGWVYLGRVDQNLGILNFGDNNDGIQILYLHNNDVFRITRMGDGTHRISDLDWGTTVDAVGWYHLGITLDGSTGNIELYLNGSDDGGSAGTSLTKLYNDDASEDFKLGYEKAGSAYFYGYMDEVAIFDRVLTAAEVSSIYSGGIQDVSSGDGGFGCNLHMDI